MDMTCIDCPTAITERISGHRLCRNCFRTRYTIPAAERRKLRSKTTKRRHCPRCIRTKAGKQFYATSAYCKTCQKAYNALRRIKNGPMIYLIRCELTGLVKIGYTAADAVKRMADLQVGSPTPLKLLDALPGSRVTEKRLHAHFGADRQHGEWFRLTPAKIKAATAMIREACTPALTC